MNVFSRVTTKVVVAGDLMAKVGIGNGKAKLLFPQLLGKSLISLSEEVEIGGFLAGRSECQELIHGWLMPEITLAVHHAPSRDRTTSVIADTNS